MRLPTAAFVAACLMAPIAITTVALAQSGPATSVPREEGNRANGLDYEPTPAEVLPRERAAGIIPPAARQQSNDQALERMDKNLLQSEGLNTKSVPTIAPRE
jgi:hypothetical protein